MNRPIVALVAYAAATIVGMLVGTNVPFFLAVVPLVAFAGIVAIVFAGFTSARNASSAFAGSTWGALAGAFTTSTCGPTHATSAFGSDVAAVAIVNVAIALALVAETLPRAIASRPHALCGALFLATVALAFAHGAEVPTWP